MILSYFYYFMLFVAKRRKLLLTNHCVYCMRSNFVARIVIFHHVPNNIKHEYLRSLAYICLSLSSPSGYLSIKSNHRLSRYSCLHLGSLHPRFFLKCMYHHEARIYIICSIALTNKNEKVQSSEDFLKYLTKSTNSSFFYIGLIVGQT